MQKPLLQILNLETEFSSKNKSIYAVNGISFNLFPGECIAIVGESGSGKSVSCLSIMRLAESISGARVKGEIIFNNKNLLQIPQSEMRKVLGKEIGMIFQDPLSGFNPLLKIGTQMLEGLFLHYSIGKKKGTEICYKMLNQVGIEDSKRVFQSYSHELSGGMRQRVMIAMALVLKPLLVIADEPTTSVDVTVQFQILSLLKKMIETTMMSMIFITHNLGIIAQIASRTIIMYAGKIMEIGNTDNILKKPAHPYTIALLKSVPDIQFEKGGDLFYITGDPPDMSLKITGCPFHPRCIYTKEICTQKNPDFILLSIQHQVACFYPIEGGLKRDDEN